MTWRRENSWPYRDSKSDPSVVQSHTKSVYRLRSSIVELLYIPEVLHQPGNLISIVNKWRNGVRLQEGAKVIVSRLHVRPTGYQVFIPVGWSAGEWIWPFTSTSAKFNSVWTFASTPLYIFKQFCLIKYNCNYTLTCCHRCRDSCHDLYLCIWSWSIFNQLILHSWSRRNRKHVIGLSAQPLFVRMQAKNTEDYWDRNQCILVER
jgi:hypothetical protein